MFRDKVNFENISGNFNWLMRDRIEMNELREKLNTAIKNSKFLAQVGNKKRGIVVLLIFDALSTFTTITVFLFIYHSSMFFIFDYELNFLWAGK